jgi:hypothetical protein
MAGTKRSVSHCCPWGQPKVRAKNFDSWNLWFVWVGVVCGRQCVDAMWMIHLGALVARRVVVMITHVNQTTANECSRSSNTHFEESRQGGTAG